MTALEFDELATWVKGLSDENKQAALTNFPTEMILEELNRRNMEVSNVLNNVKSIIESIDADTTLEEMEVAIKNIRSNTEMR